MAQHTFKFEFNPREFLDIHALIKKAQELCFEQHGVSFNQYDFTVKPVRNNAEFHVFKTIIYN
jgi:hypothetical protein